MKNFIYLLLSVFMLSGCLMPIGNQPSPFLENPQTNNQWVGTYQGILPCKDCEGIAAMIVLNADRSYSVRSQRLGIDHIDRKTDGTFNWVANHDGYIQLRMQNVTQTYRLGHRFIQWIPDQKSPNNQTNAQDFILNKTN